MGAAFSRDPRYRQTRDLDWCIAAWCGDHRDIGNTIRLDIQNRREEIEVTKLIGGSNAFVRRPFLWSGFWYGLFGGLLALALVQYGLFMLEQPAARLAGLYQSGTAILALSRNEILSILATGIGLGLVGSWFAAARHMRRIEPR